MGYTKGRNLIAVSNLVLNVWITNSGVEGGSTKCASTEYIPVEPNSVMTLQFWQPENSNEGTDRAWSGRLLFFDNDKKYLSGYAGEYFSAEHRAYTVTTPEACRYVRATYQAPLQYHGKWAKQETYSALKWKLEYGSEATEWRPAPEDKHMFPEGGVDFMILARNIIALARINDVTGTTYYYKSQVSTAAKPAKPTSATPSGWSTTEPSYNAANSVYVTVKTTYSDNSFSYSDVSLASAYEGAKEAHNTAASAKSTAEAAMEQSVEYITGTQTGATESWTGVTSDTTLAVGKTIAYKLPFAGSGNASLTLTLAGGSKTAAIPVYLNTTRVTTHFGAGAVINMTYDGSAWRASSIPNSNNYDRIQYKASVTAVGAIAAGRIGVFNSDGKLILLSNTPFDVSKPILYIGTEYKTGALTQTNNYISWGTAFSLANTVSGFSGTAGATVYIKGTLNGSMFTPASGVLTTTPPTSEDGYTYILLGLMSTTVNAVLAAEHPMFRYYNGGFKTISQISYEAFVAANAAYGQAWEASDSLDNYKEQNPEDVLDAIEKALKGDPDAEDPLDRKGALGRLNDSIDNKIAATQEGFNKSMSDLSSIVNELNSDYSQYATTFSQLFKYVRFPQSDNFTGIEIGLLPEEGQSPMQIKVGQKDGKNVVMLYNGEDNFGFWDGVDFHTGNIYVDVREQARFGNFAFVPRGDGSLMFLKVAED